MRTIEIKWGTSRGRNTYGYITCNLYENGERKAACNGGGYDMRGTVVGSWLARSYADRLRALRPEDMPENSHWVSDRHAFICRECIYARIGKDLEPVTLRTESDLPDPYPRCPECGEEMSRDNQAGHREITGRSFHGLTFHDPKFDPGKAVIGKDATDRTLGGAEGETVEEAERAGKSLGLERYQAFYSASSKHATERHTVPSIDGGCGIESVRRIAEAIGVSLRQVVNRSKLDVYEIIDSREVAK